MNEIPFIEELNKELLENERIFKFRSAEVTKGKYLALELLLNSYSYNNFFDADLKKKVEGIIKKILPKSLSVNIRFIKTITDKDLIRKAIFEYINKEKPTFYDNFVNSDMDIEIIGNMVYINIALEKFMCDFANNSELGTALSESLSKDFMEDFEVHFLEIPNKESHFEDRIPDKLEYSLRFINVEINASLWGSILQNPRYIVDVKEKTYTDVCLCGVISNVKEKYIESIKKNLFTFQLYDTTGYIPCKAFINTARKDQLKFAQSMLDGNTMIMQGQIKFDSYDNALSFIPNKAAFCTIDYNSIDTTPKYLTERENYLYVSPQKYIEEVQIDMLSEGIPKELYNKTFVVFDFETTGTEVDKCAVTDIGAVKIVNGRITETFTSLVNPEMEIPEEVVNLTHITNEMVKNERPFGEIIGDFYKFTRGEEVVLVAHNAPFDMAFLRKYAAINNYNFDNNVMDTLVLARQKLQLKKYKLINLCEKFQITLNGAHRALNDAIATAKVFIKLFSL